MDDGELHSSNMEGALPSLSELVLRTLTDFEVIAGAGHGALILPRHGSTSSLRESLVATVVADRLGLTSVDSTRRRYVTGNELPINTPDRSGLVAYRTAMAHIRSCRENFTGSPRSEPRLGTVAASVALERLPISFSAGHVLYTLGLHHEGDVVARQILEQIAWAVTVHSMDDEEQISRASPTDMRQLKSVAPHAGQFYGLLSDSTHLKLEHHQALVSFEGDVGSINLTWKRAKASALVLLHLADLWVISYEWTQFSHMNRCIALRNSSQRRLRKKRPFSPTCGPSSPRSKTDGMDPTTRRGPRSGPDRGPLVSPAQFSALPATHWSHGTAQS